MSRHVYASSSVPNPPTFQPSHLFPTVFAKTYVPSAPSTSPISPHSLPFSNPKRSIRFCAFSVCAHTNPHSLVSSRSQTVFYWQIGAPQLHCKCQSKHVRCERTSEMGEQLPAPYDDSAYSPSYRANHRCGGLHNPTPLRYTPSTPSSTSGSAQLYQSTAPQTWPPSLIYLPPHTHPKLVWGYGCFGYLPRQMFGIFHIYLDQLQNVAAESPRTAYTGSQSPLPPLCQISAPEPQW